MFQESTLKYIDLSNITKIEEAAFCNADLTGVINIPNLSVLGGRSNGSGGTYHSCFKNNSHMTEIHLGTNVPYA
jgi:hypothetical protein